MKTHRVDFSLTGMCHRLNVSRSGYYAWLQRKPSQRLERHQALDEQVKFLFYQYKQRHPHGYKWLRKIAAKNA